MDLNIIISFYFYLDFQQKEILQALTCQHGITDCRSHVMYLDTFYGTTLRDIYSSVLLSLFYKDELDRFIQMWNTESDLKGTWRTLWASSHNVYDPHLYGSDLFQCDALDVQNCQEECHMMTYPCDESLIFILQRMQRRAETCTLGFNRRDEIYRHFEFHVLISLAFYVSLSLFPSLQYLIILSSLTL